MTSNIHWMIAAAGADAQQTRQAGFSCVHFCSRRIRARGSLCRAKPALHGNFGGF